ncbi:kinase-like domain-containing protein [Gigaspora rosea]|uniref:Kinase-like domain-containing protein n=1 Tax=Gigaspora rosea TaxID=44941 RepID=A0A397VP56_9GLOM|nr:kinase-like domain-containing protein [Gigaspora rosea]
MKNLQSPKVLEWEPEFNKEEKIGQGSFGNVYVCYSKDLKKVVALKSLKNVNNDQKKKFDREVKIMNECDHDNIIQFFGITKGIMEYMVLLYANDGDLRCYLKVRFSGLTWSDKLKMAKEIACGINYLHGKNIKHRDLHDKNVLVHNGRPMIADFGLSKPPDSNSLTQSFDHAIGMPAYRDPKYLAYITNYKRDESSAIYTREKPSDIYSLGVLFWELTSGKPPFENVTDTEIIQRVIKGERETPIDGTPADFVKLIEETCHGDPEKRPTIEKICFQIDSQVLPMQIGRDLNSLFHYNCSLEDRPKFIVQILDLENVVVRSEELRKESVDADKVVKVACFLVAAVFEIAVVIANFYFQGVFDVFLSCVFLNCPSAIIIFVAAARNKNTVMAFSVEGIVVALKVNYEDVHNFVSYVSKGLKALVTIFNFIFISFVKFSNASFAVSNLIQN